MESVNHAFAPFKSEDLCTRTDNAFPPFPRIQSHMGEQGIACLMHLKGLFNLRMETWTFCAWDIGILGYWDIGKWPCKHKFNISSSCQSQTMSCHFTKHCSGIFTAESEVENTLISTWIMEYCLSHFFISSHKWAKAVSLIAPIVLYMKYKCILKKSCIRETKNLSTDADSSTDTKKIRLGRQNLPKNKLFVRRNFTPFMSKSFQTWDYFFPFTGNSNTCPQGFQKSKKCGLWTSGSGGKKRLNRINKWKIIPHTGNKESLDRCG